MTVKAEACTGKFLAAILKHSTKASKAVEKYENKDDFNLSPAAERFPNMLASVSHVSYVVAQSQDKSQDLDKHTFKHLAIGSFTVIFQ